MRRILLATFAAFVLNVGASGAASAGQQDFRLVNRTNYQIDSVWVSKSTTSSWEEDVLGEDVLPTGRSVNIRFNGSTRGCIFDLKVKYNDGETAEFGNINLCEVSVVTLRYQGGTTRATTE